MIADTPPDLTTSLILELTEARGPGKSICPSEVARRLKPEGWQSLMTQVRLAAIRLSAAGRIDILRKGKPVAPEAVHGVIRLRIREFVANESLPSDSLPVESLPE